MNADGPIDPPRWHLRTRLARGLARVAQWVLPRFSELGGPGTCIAPVILTGAVSIWAATLLHPMVATAYAAEPAGVAGGMLTWIWLLAGLSPLLALAKAGVLGSAGWGMLVLAGGRPRFVPVLSALLYGEVILALQGAWIAGVLHLRGSGSISRPAHLRVVTGMTELLQGGPPAVVALGQGLSFFHLAWLAFLSLAFAHVARTSRLAGCAAAALVWVFLVGLGVLRALVA